MFIGKGQYCYMTKISDALHIPGFDGNNILSKLVDKCMYFTENGTYSFSTEEKIIDYTSKLVDVMISYAMVI